MDPLRPHLSGTLKKVPNPAGGIRGAACQLSIGKDSSIVSPAKVHTSRCASALRLLSEWRIESVLIHEIFAREKEPVLGCVDLR